MYEDIVGKCDCRSDFEECILYLPVGQCPAAEVGAGEGEEELGMQARSRGSVCVNVPLMHQGPKWAYSAGYGSLDDTF